jgi:hypothetical protein
MEKLKGYIQAHGIEAMIHDNELIALGEYLENGKLFTEWEKLEPTFEAVRAWLGY